MINDQNKLDKKLIRAVEQALPESVEKAIRLGANPNTDFLDSPLHYAVENDNQEIVEILIKHGADPNLHSSISNSALTRASRKCNNKLLKLLLSFGASPNIEHGEALLVSAAMKNNDAVVLLLNNGANPNSQGIFRMSSPLFEAASLCANHARDLWSNPAWGRSVIEVENKFHGQKRGHKHKKDELESVYFQYLQTGVEIADVLIRAGADINYNNSGGGTALHQAVITEYLLMQMFLLRRGANIEIKNFEGDTARDLYINSGMGDFLGKLEVFLESEHPTGKELIDD